MLRGFLLWTWGGVALNPVVNDATIANRMRPARSRASGSRAQVRRGGFRGVLGGLGIGGICFRGRWCADAVVPLLIQIEGVKERPRSRASGSRAHVRKEVFLLHLLSRSDGGGHASMPKPKLFFSTLVENAFWKAP